MGAFLRNRLLWSLMSSFLSCCVLAFSSLGEITFERTFGGTERDYGFHVQQTQDGGYVFAGWTWSFGAGFYDVYLVKTDATGDTVWTRTYGGIHYDGGYSVWQAQDGGYIIAGITWSFGAGETDVYMIKTDPTGDTVWTKTHGGIAWDEGRSVQQTQDGGYVIAGSTLSFGAGETDVYMIKTDPTGDTVWTKTYGGSGVDYGFSVQETQDGGYVIAAWTWSFGAGADDVYLVKTDATGDTVWTRTYGGIDYDRGSSVQQTQDGGYIIAGATGSFGAGGDDVYLVRTDSFGDTLWTRTYGGIDDDGGYSVRQTQDGGYIIAGATWSFGAGENDVYLIKTDENGLTGVEETGSRSPSSRRAFRLHQSSPNPVLYSAVISYSLPQASEVTLTIYDITGRLVETLVNETQEPGIHEVRWNRSDNPSGVYFCRLKAGEFTETRKMVVVE